MCGNVVFMCQFDWAKDAQIAVKHDFCEGVC